MKMSDVIVQIDTEKREVYFVVNNHEFVISKFLTGSNSVYQTVLSKEDHLRLIKYLLSKYEV